jgi:hypothetical protein
MTIHSQLAGGAWGHLDLPEQLAHVGSEVERAIRAWNGGRRGRFESAQDRALELFDLTARDDRWKGPRRREILRAREEFVRLFHGEPPDPASIEGLQRYFLAFAILARRRASSRGG